MALQNIELDGMRQAEHEQKLVDLFWGIDKEKEDSIQCAIGMSREDTLSRRYGKMIAAAEIQLHYEKVRREREEMDARNHAEKEESKRRSYMRIFNETTSSDIIMTYDWNIPQSSSQSKGIEGLDDWLLDVTSMTQFESRTGSFHTNYSRARQMRVKMTSEKFIPGNSGLLSESSHSLRRPDTSSSSYSRGGSSGLLAPIPRKPKNGSRRKKNKHLRQPSVPRDSPVGSDYTDTNSNKPTPGIPIDSPSTPQECVDTEKLWETIFASAATCETGDQHDTASGAALLKIVQRSHEDDQKDSINRCPCLRALVKNSRLQDMLSSLHSCFDDTSSLKLRLVEWIEFCNAIQDLITWNSENFPQ